MGLLRGCNCLRYLRCRVVTSPLSVLMTYETTSWLSVHLCSRMVPLVSNNLVLACWILTRFPRGIQSFFYFYLSSFLHASLRLLISSWGFILLFIEFGILLLTLLIKKRSFALPVMFWEMLELIWKMISLRATVEITFGDFLKVLFRLPTARSASEFDSWKLPHHLR